MKMFLLTVVFPLLTCAKEWAYSQDPDAKAGVLIGVGASSLNGADLAASAMGDNGIGAEISIYSGGAWERDAANTGMLLDSAIMPSGEVMCPGLGNVVYSNTTGSPYTTLDLGYFVTSQSANVIEATGSFALVGQFVEKSTKKQSNGVMILSSQGDVQGCYDVGVPSTNLARYGAFPTADTWYITSGMWDTDDEEKNEATKNGKKKLTRQVSLNNDQKLDFNRSPKPLKKSTATDSDTGWYMTISKTTDGGNTFTTVYSSPADSYYYPNGVSCADENHCVVAAEGYDSDGTPQVWAFLTQDGGATWTDTLTKGVGELGLMAANFISADEAWLGGFGVDGHTYEGHFWHSTDGGLSWELGDALDNCLVLDMDFDSTTGTGYAACVPPSGAAGTIAMYA
jgi:hypothetical protein